LHGTAGTGARSGGVREAGALAVCLIVVEAERALLFTGRL